MRFKASATSFRRKLLPRLCEVGFHSLADHPGSCAPLLRLSSLTGGVEGGAGAAAAFGFVLTLAFFFTARLGAAFLAVRGDVYASMD